MRREGLIFLIMICVLLPIRAVETIIVGTVRDAGTGHVIENANVFFKHTKIGTTTNDEGFFFLRLDVRADVKMTISALGYKSQQLTIQPGMAAGVDVLLEERVTLLNEVEALPGDNPALALMKKVRAQRHEHSRKGYDVLGDGVESGDESAVRYFISDIQPRHLKKRFYQQFEHGLLMREDSTFILPLPDNLRAEYALPLPEHLDFYQSTIPFHSASFVSPLAAGANGFYRFYLLDSVEVRYGDLREKHYRVHFLPKNTFDPTFQGILDIDSATCALRHIEASAPRNVNINYLNGFSYRADYLPTSELADEHIAALFEVGVKSDTSHLFPSLLAERKMLAPRTMAVDTLHAGDSAVAAFLAAKTPTPIASNISDSVAQAMQDTLAGLPLFRVAKWAAQLCLTGYIPTGTCIDIGRISDIIRYTPEEHLYLGLPFRTNERLWQHVSLGGYVGYAFRDRKVRYLAEMNVLFPTPRRHLMQVSLADRYAYTDVSPMDELKHENSISSTNMRFTTFALQGVEYKHQQARYTAARRRELRVAFEDDWTSGRGALPGVETTTSVQLGHQGYGNPLDYMYHDQPSYRYASLRSIVRLGWQERHADFYMQRRHIGGKYPTLYLGAEMGSYRFDAFSRGMTPSSSYRLYGRFSVMLRQEVPLGVGGTLSYLFDAGVVAGAVPYPLLGVMNGNQGITYQPERFTLMQMGQYAADRYLQLHLDWDGRGILFGRIPGVRYLRLHELVEAKLAYGGLSARNAQLAAEMGMPAVKTLTIPYAEVGVGIGNILRIGEVYSVWRLTHRDDPAAALWAIRFRLHISM